MNTNFPNIDKRVVLLADAGHKLLQNTDKWKEVSAKAAAVNPWFTPGNIESAREAVAKKYLNASVLEEAVRRYDLPEQPDQIKTIGMVLAGNIPLVGVHDIICTFLCGHISRIKPSSKDDALIRYFVDLLGPEVSGYFAFEEQLKGADAYIATGSDNSARYFKAYFGKYPHIIRHNRNGVGVLSGDESEEQLIRLGRDVFQYFGLGCRNISKIFVPHGYDFEALLSIWHENYKDLILHAAYKNNYDYSYAVYLLSKQPFLMTGSLLLIEDERLASRIATLHYSYYDSLTDLKERLEKEADGIQVIASEIPDLGFETVPFGETQNPGMFDYADGKDTIDFLKQLR